MTAYSRRWLASAERAGDDMAVALAVIVLLGVGLPAGGWLLTLRKKFWTANKAGWIAGNDDLDRWLADQFHLSWPERDRVRAAVLLGRKAPAHLQVPVRELAAAVLANRFATVRRVRWLFWIHLTGAVLYLLRLVVLRLCHLPSAAVRPDRIRRNAERALTTGVQAGPSGPGRPPAVPVPARSGTILFSCYAATEHRVHYYFDI